MKCTFTGRECGFVFAGGLVLGLAVRELLTREQIRELAIKGVERGIVLRDSAKENMEIIRHKTSDIYNEAMTKKSDVFFEENDFEEDDYEEDLVAENIDIDVDVEYVASTENNEEEADDEALSI